MYKLMRMCLTPALSPAARLPAGRYAEALRVFREYYFDYTHCDWIAGYELQVYLGHALNPDGNRVKREEDLSYWYPATRLHGLGTWSMPLAKGFHEIKIVYIDFRMDGAKRLNRVEGLRDCVWRGEKPDLLLSGPGVPKQPIPAAWLWRQ